MKHRTVIIGCGNIAGELDKDQVDSDRKPITHTKAYQKNENFDVVACVEPNSERRLRFQKDWSIDKSFSTIEELVSKKIEIDVVSICSPTTFHGEHLDKALSLNPKLVFCEKPLYDDLNYAKSIVKKYKKNNVHLLVNYSRRFDPSVAALKQAISSEKYGKLRAIHGCYNKGLLNNGSHIIDLLIFLLGNLSLEHVGNGVCDYNLQDLSYPLFLSTHQEISINLSCGNANDFSLTELEFLFSNGRIKMLNGGLNWSIENVEKDPLFKGYKILGNMEFSEGEYLQSFSNAVSNIHNCLTKNEKLRSSGEDALKVLKLHSEIINRTQNNIKI